MKIIFYGPFGKNIPPEKIGGAEAGCLKTLNIYRTHGYDVVTLEKAVNTGNRLGYLFGVICVYIRLIYLCLRYRDALVHIVGFYGKVLGIERMMVKTAQRLGHKTVYEMRNGGLVKIYKNASNKYQRKQKELWSIADGLLCQGSTFVDFIRHQTGINSFYYPNFVPEGYGISSEVVEDRLNNRDTFDMVFFGRLVPAKNIGTIIEATALIHKKYPRARLHLIGGVSEEYKQILDETIKNLELPDDVVKFHGHRDFHYISEVLSHSSFFLFPSEEACEGHSNSLTEAMGFGVVPILSRAGFNESICGDRTLILDDITPEAIADKVVCIIENGTWLKYSQAMRRRIEKNFTEPLVGHRLVEYINNVYSTK